MSADSLPSTSIRPFVGTMIPARCLSIVLLPAPLWPTMPSASPLRTSSDTSLSAQKSRFAPDFACGRPSARRARLGTRSRSESKRSPSAKRLDTCSNRMAISLTAALDVVGEARLEPVKKLPAAQEHEEGDNHAVDEPAGLGRLVEHDGRAQPLEQRC